MSQKIRIKLKSYDHNLLDKSAEKIVKTVKSTQKSTWAIRIVCIQALNGYLQQFF